MKLDDIIEFEQEMRRRSTNARQVAAGYAARASLAGCSQPEELMRQAREAELRAQRYEERAKKARRRFISEQTKDLSRLSGVLGH